MPVSKRLRMEVFRRDNHTCRYCGAHAPDVKITVDHVNPVALGGTDEPSNLVTACVQCNAGKSSIVPGAPLVDDVANSAMRWAEALTLVAEDRRRQRADFAEDAKVFDAAWSGWTWGDDQPVPRDDGWVESLRRWRATGLDLGELTDLIPTAMRSKASPRETWRYFCGCAWRAVQETQEMAQETAEQMEEYDRYFAGRNGAT